MDSSTHYNSVYFYIQSLQPIKADLKTHETEYHPEKVRSLIASYKLTLIKIISHSKDYLRTEKDDWKKLCDIERILHKYEKHLNSL